MNSAKPLVGSSAAESVSLITPLSTDIAAETAAATGHLQSRPGSLNAPDPVIPRAHSFSGKGKHHGTSRMNGRGIEAEESTVMDSPEDDLSKRNGENFY